MTSYPSSQRPHAVIALIGKGIMSSYLLDRFENGPFQSCSKSEAVVSFQTASEDRQYERLFQGAMDNRKGAKGMVCLSPFQLRWQTSEGPSVVSGLPVSRVSRATAKQVDEYCLSRWQNALELDMLP